jgi:hypothetical protein
MLVILYRSNVSFSLLTTADVCPSNSVAGNDMPDCNNSYCIRVMIFFCTYFSR